jgi:hypothetical protein
MSASKNQLLSIVIVLAVAVLAIAGFLLIMGRLSASNTPVAGSDDERNAVTTVVVASETDAPVPDAQRQPPSLVDDPDPLASVEPTPPEEIIVTVNSQIIARDARQQATRLEAVMSRLAHQPIPSAEETLDRLVNEILVLAAAIATPAATC